MMNPMIFPKMMFSHADGWDWLVRVHPSVMRMYLFYAVPLSLIPPAMLFYAWHAYSHTLLTEISMSQALFMCVLFFLVELIMVPAMGAVVQRIVQIADIEMPYQDSFALAAIVPTPLWLAPLFLFVPSMLVNVLVLALALIGSGLLIYHGVGKLSHVDDEGKSILLAGSVIAAGLVAWAGMMVLTFVVWGIAVA